jgi:hypothetical protein
MYESSVTLRSQAKLHILQKGKRVSPIMKRRIIVISDISLFVDRANAFVIGSTAAPLLTGGETNERDVQ